MRRRLRRFAISRVRSGGPGHRWSMSCAPGCWQEFARAHGEVFGAIRPATSMVEVRRLIAPEMLIEIEAEAVIG